MEMEMGYIQDSGSGRWGWLSLGAEGEELEQQGPPANIAQSIKHTELFTVNCPMATTSMYD